MRKNDDVEDRAAKTTPVDTDASKTEASAPGIASGDEEDAKRVLRNTITRERASRSKRAHEPVDYDDADDEQPVEDDNGPRLPEVAAAESARVEDPAQSTSNTDDISGATVKKSSLVADVKASTK